MPKAKFVVAEKHLLKEGQGQFGTWQLVKIVAEDGNEYTTFNGNFYQTGKEYEVSYEEKTNGKYTSKTLQDKPESKTDKKVKEAVGKVKSEQDTNHKEIMNALRMIYALIESKGEEDPKKAGGGVF